MSCCVNDSPTVPLDSLMRHMAIHVPEVPYVVALDLIRERFKELARKSSLLVAFVELPIQAGVNNYFLEAPEGYDIFSVKAAGHPMGWQWQHADAHHWFSSWGYRFWVKDNTEVVFDRTPSSDESERYLLLTVIPSDCATVIPVSVAGPYGQAIAAGAVADALRMPQKAWSNPSLAQTYELKFQRAAASAKALAITNRGAVTPEMRPIRIL
jgi:hypothetical protein